MRKKYEKKAEPPTLSHQLLSAEIDIGALSAAIPLLTEVENADLNGIIRVLKATQELILTKKELLELKMKQAEKHQPRLVSERDLNSDKELARGITLEIVPTFHQAVPDYPYPILPYSEKDKRKILALPSCLRRNLDQKLSYDLYNGEKLEVSPDTKIYLSGAPYSKQRKYYAVHSDGSILQVYTFTAIKQRKLVNREGGIQIDMNNVKKIKFARTLKREVIALTLKNGTKIQVCTRSVYNAKNLKERKRKERELSTQKAAQSNSKSSSSVELNSNSVLSRKRIKLDSEMVRNNNTDPSPQLNGSIGNCRDSFFFAKSDSNPKSDLNSAPRPSTLFTE